jgi:hypothetical protein
MTIETPLHAAHQLDQLAGQFEAWRQRRAHPHERIPEPLWAQAVALTAIREARQRGLSQRAVVAELARQGFTTRVGTLLGLRQVQRIMEQARIV